MCGEAELREKVNQFPWPERGFLIPRNEDPETEKRQDFLGLRPHDLTYLKLILYMCIWSKWLLDHQRYFIFAKNGLFSYIKVIVWDNDSGRWLANGKRWTGCGNKRAS